MKKRVSIVLTVATILTMWIVATPCEQPRNNVKTFMRAKLDHMQKVLEGVATGEFAMIQKSAGEISVLSQAAQWQVLRTPVYQQHSDEFRRAADAAAKAAKNKNLDGAALAYVDMTMKCVKCHKYVVAGD